MLYLVTFCLPRFLDQDFDDKFITLFHELYHISPAFDGDLRRHAGRCDLHSNSKRLYDAHMADLARSYLSNGADHGLHDFLRLNFAQLTAATAASWASSSPARGWSPSRKIHHKDTKDTKKRCKFSFPRSALIVLHNEEGRRGKPGLLWELGMIQSNDLDRPSTHPRLRPRLVRLHHPEPLPSYVER